MKFRRDILDLLAYETGHLAMLLRTASINDGHVISGMRMNAL